MNKENIIQKFRDVLLGKNIHLKTQPKDLLFYKADADDFYKYAEIITSKINKAAPKNLILTENYS